MTSPFTLRLPHTKLFYILDEQKNAIPVSEMEGWTQWFETADRIVAKTMLKSEVVLSTAFLGINHGKDDEPLLFESMIFGGDWDGECWRYATWKEAEAGHQRLVQELSTQ